jgi:hypothetical protein
MTEVARARRLFPARLRRELGSRHAQQRNAPRPRNTGPARPYGDWTCGKASQRKSATLGGSRLVGHRNGPQRTCAWAAPKMGSVDALAGSQTYRTTMRRCPTHSSARWSMPYWWIATMLTPGPLLASLRYRAGYFRSAGHRLMRAGRLCTSPKRRSNDLVARWFRDCTRWCARRRYQCRASEG